MFAMTVVIIELVVLVSLGGIGDGRGGLDGCDERNFCFGVVVVVVIVVLLVVVVDVEVMVIATVVVVAG